MDKAKATPKDFFLWAGAMAALYGAVIAFIGLLFDYINYALPDALAYYYGGNPYQGSVAYEMASLIVLAPLCLILMRVIRREIARDPSRNEIWVRRWALFLTLFVAGATIAIDLIVLLTTFFRGEALTAEKMKACRWVKPVLVCQVDFVEWTDGNKLRHCSFIGMRDDKSATKVVREV